MSVMLMVFVAALLEGLYETCVNIWHVIKHQIDIYCFKLHLRKRRSGKRANYKTRFKYKIESMIDSITS